MTLYDFICLSTLEITGDHLSPVKSGDGPVMETSSSFSASNRISWSPTVMAKCYSFTPSTKHLKTPQ